MHKGNPYPHGKSMNVMQYFPLQDPYVPNELKDMHSKHFGKYCEMRTLHYLASTTYEVLFQMFIQIHQPFQQHQTVYALATSAMIQAR